MFCKKCGHKRENGEKFCPVCGTPFPREIMDAESPELTNGSASNIFTGRLGGIKKIAHIILSIISVLYGLYFAIMCYSFWTEESPSIFWIVIELFTLVALWSLIYKFIKSTLILRYLISFVIFFGVFYFEFNHSQHTGEDRNKIENDYQESVASDDGSGELNGEGSEEVSSRKEFNSDAEVWGYVLGHSFKAKDGSSIRISQEGVYRNGECFTAAPQLISFLGTSAVFRANSPVMGRTITFIVGTDSNDFTMQ